MISFSDFRIQNANNPLVAMTALSELFSQLYTKIIVLLALILIQLAILIHKLRRSTRPITATQFLKLIEEKNPSIAYTKRLKPEHEDCRVCLSELEEGDRVRTLKCKHTFHKDCLDQWLQQYCATCPLCRYRLVPDDVVVKYRLLQNQVENDEQSRIIFLLSALHGGGGTLHRYP